MTVVPVVPLAHEVERLSARLRALERRLHEQGHTVRLLPCDDRLALGRKLLQAFAVSGELDVVELLHECCANHLVEQLRLTIVQENLPFNPNDLLPDLVARLLRAARNLNDRETFAQLTEPLAKSVVLDAQKGLSRSLVREQRAVEIEFPTDVNPLWQLPVGAEDVHQGFAALPEGYRRCLVLRDRDGLPYYDIGDQAGLDANVATRIRRARERLYQLATYRSSGRSLLVTELNYAKCGRDAAKS